jgi:hypothetical protein
MCTEKGGSGQKENFKINQYKILPITVAAQCKAWNVFARTNAGVVGSNPTQDMDVFAYILFVLSCVRRDLETDWSPVQGVLATVQD